MRGGKRRGGKREPNMHGRIEKGGRGGGGGKRLKDM